MESEFAYIQYIKPIGITDETINGEIVQRNYEANEGQIDLTSKFALETEKKYFPDRIKGEVIKKENLLNMVKYCYDILKKDIENLPEMDTDIRVRIEAFESVYGNGEVMAFNGFKRDHQKEEKMIDEIANKFIILQNTVREKQRLYGKKTQHR